MSMAAVCGQHPWQREHDVTTAAMRPAQPSAGGSAYSSRHARAASLATHLCCIELISHGEITRLHPRV